MTVRWFDSPAREQRSPPSKCSFSNRLGCSAPRECLGMKRSEMYRTHLDEYAEKWAEFFHFKREDGILEIRMHTESGPCHWGLEIHRALIPMFADVGHDPENECLIFTGTGDSFLALSDDESWKRNRFESRFGLE